MDTSKLGGGNVTGLAFTPKGTLYCVTDSGNLLKVTNWQNPGFQAVPADPGDPNATPPVPPKPAEIKSNGKGATLSLVGTVADASFEGLTVGPPDVAQIDGSGNVTYPFANLLFAVGADGSLYALDPAQPNSLAQPIFNGGMTSVNTGIGDATGIAFSTLDYNLWHVTSQ